MSQIVSASEKSALSSADTHPAAKPKLRDLLRRAPEIESVDAQDIGHLRDLHAAMLNQTTPKR